MFTKDEFLRGSFREKGIKKKKTSNELKGVKKKERTKTCDGAKSVIQVKDEECFRKKF